MRPFQALAAATSAGFVAVVGLHAVAGPTGASGATTVTTSPTSVPTTTAGGVRSAVGATEQFGYGAIAVKVTANGQRVIAVSIANFQAAEQYSQQLASQAIPILTSEALAAQSANIQGVSGASYTSAGFAQSLQSALQSLGI